MAIPLSQQVLEARLDELDVLLEQASEEFKGVSASLAIVVRFELVRRRSEVGESDLNSYELEARLLSLISGPQFGSDEEASSEPQAGPVTRALLAISGALVGTHDFVVPERPWLPDLERAFLYERARRYRQAIDAYEEILVSNVLPDKTADVVELHRAFCLAMSNDDDAARYTVTTIITNTPDPEIAKLGMQILDFLHFVEDRRAELAQTSIGGLELGRSLYFAMDYARAESVLSDFVDERTGDPREAEARFYLGRIREERGDSEDALREYFRVELLDPSGPWAIESMRRILVLASLYYSDPELANESHRQLVRLNDQEFTETVDPYRSIVQTVPRVSAGEAPLEEPEAQPTPPELFVRTEPSGATITIDGVRRGVSPLFVEDLSVGSVIVEAAKDDYKGQARVEVREGEITSVFLSLGKRFGALRIATSLEDVVVYLDETSSYSLDSPALKQINPGTYSVLIEGVRANGQLFVTERDIVIRPDETTVVELE